MTEESRELDLLRQRRANFDELVRLGVDPYPRQFERSDTIEALVQAHGPKSGEALDATPVATRTAGRILAIRAFGKANFLVISDGHARIQVYIRQDSLPERDFNIYRLLDFGDFVGVEGQLFRTKTNELTIKASRLEFLAKCFIPLPEKWHGLHDVETRYRQRYLDLIVNPGSRRVFEVRSRVLAAIRTFLNGRGYLEVETPMMQPIAGGALARPFVTYHNALDMRLFMRIAPELYLKRLTVGGLERVYEINRNFRNEGVSTRHNPEFTMLELYEAYATYNEIMDLTENLIRDVAVQVRGTAQLTWEDMAIDLAPAFRRWSMSDAVLEHNPEIGRGELRDLDAMRAHCRRLGIRIKDSYGWGKLLLEIFEKTVEHTLVQPTFITEHPTEVSPLARARDADPDVTDRFELFVGGRELANGFSELNDPEDQKARFLAQVEAKEGGDDEAMHYDADYIRALEYGMAPTGGLGIGIDRLVMLITDSASIRDVLLFPYMRPEA